MAWSKESRAKAAATRAANKASKAAAAAANKITKPTTKKSSPKKTPVVGIKDSSKKPLPARKVPKKPDRAGIMPGSAFDIEYALPLVLSAMEPLEGVCQWLAEKGYVAGNSWGIPENQDLFVAREAVGRWDEWARRSWPRRYVDICVDVA